jgi:glyoxylase I family protein
MANPILGDAGFHHVSVKTRDWAATRRFYVETLGCTEKVGWRAAPQRAALFDTGNGNYVEVFEDLVHQPAPGGAIGHFALRTTRLDEVAARIRAAGYRITVEPKSVTLTTTGGTPLPIRIFFCEGPNGEILEFFQNELT